MHRYEDNKAHRLIGSDVIKSCSSEAFPRGVLRFIISKVLDCYTQWIKFRAGGVEKSICEKSPIDNEFRITISP